MESIISNIRKEFPILQRKVNNHAIVYLDNAASSQKPLCVVEAEKQFYLRNYSATHRALHTLSRKSTDLVEKTREKVKKFINAESCEEIVFVKGATEGINLAANTWGKKFLKQGDNIIITLMEHHANIVPWQIIAKEKNIEIRVLPINSRGELNYAVLDTLIDRNTKLLAITQISNVLGLFNSVEKITQKLRKLGIAVLVDGAQAVMHKKINIQKMNCDFFTFSAHKMCGPTGVGILYINKRIVQDLPPWQGGGGIVEDVFLPQGTTFCKAPWKFEAGTLNIAGIVGLGAAVDYITDIGFDVIQKIENDVASYMMEKIKEVPNIKIYGNQCVQRNILSFNLKGLHAYDVGTLLDQYGVAIRTGHHCAAPLMHYYKVSSMCRLSLSFYNTKQEIDSFIASLKNIDSILRKYG